ncbi:MAG TPA: RNA-binding S4 domain-containing protein [Flavobacteriaceae bacterium]|nr:RNA-binding S4 domain-containing protein [Flavobacteriaceae bacterium]
MRIDRYLWATRYYKTRNQAANACKGGTVKLNNKSAKPARDVFVGDEISVRRNQITYTLRVIDLPKSRVGAKLVDQYRIDTTPREAIEQAKQNRKTQQYYRNKGLGRPTKRDRRAIEEYLNSNRDQKEDF